jgi:hypothetical protein
LENIASERVYKEVLNGVQVWKCRFLHRQTHSFTLRVYTIIVTRSDFIRNFKEHGLNHFVGFKRIYISILSKIPQRNCFHIVCFGDFRKKVNILGGSNDCSSKFEWFSLSFPNVGRLLVDKSFRNISSIAKYLTADEATPYVNQTT